MSLTSDSETRICDNTDSVLLLKFGNGMLVTLISELLYVKVEYLWMYCFFL